MATQALQVAQSCAKPSLYDRIAADNRSHPLERTRIWQAHADAAAEYARTLRTRGKTPIQAAGERLDIAVTCFRMVADDPRPEVVEELFGSAEREYLDAKQGYMAELVKLTGETAANLERRVAA